MGVFTLRDVEDVGSIGCVIGGGLVVHCGMVEISKYAFEVDSPYVREGRLEDLF